MPKSNATIIVFIFLGLASFPSFSANGQLLAEGGKHEAISAATERSAVVHEDQSLSTKRLTPAPSFVAGLEQGKSSEDVVAGILPLLDKGGATFIASIIASLTSLITLGFSVWSSRKLAYLSGVVSDQTNVKKENREYRLSQLTSFYDPIYTLLSANQNIFNRIGPRSNTRDVEKYNSDETAEIWAKLSLDVIVPNNMRVCAIIEENLHYLDDKDNESLYLDFLTHAHAYKVFKDDAYEAYELFQFPAGFYDSIKEHRELVQGKLREIYSYE
ncbi:hypothetical protein [Herbaspirillum huttiense]|uniref:hypothetical protein n=1 Tax=Herbaspirillum huttiense TaxID=863372 RepID=UPI0031E07AD3